MSSGTWKRYRLDEVCLVITDGAHRSPPSIDSGGYPMASVKDLTPFGIRIDTCRRIAESDYQELVRGKCQPLAGDVLIAKDGNSALDTVCEVKELQELVLLSSVAILRPDPTVLSSAFLRYYLDCETTRQYLKSGFISGAAIPRVILKDFKRAEIVLPPLSIQQRIAAVLSAYDDLIEVNQQRIEALEAAAQALYREWFVEMRFPGYESAEWVESELGVIPAGWAVRSFAQTADFVNGYAFRPSDWSDQGLPIIKIAELNNGITAKTPYYPGNDIPGKYHLRNGDVLFAWSATLDVYVWRSGPAFLNQHIFNVLPFESFTKEYIYLALKHRMPEFRALSQGTTTKHIRRSALDEVKLVVPSGHILTVFDEHVGALFAHVQNLTSTNALLRETRDLLLPRLISGEVSVEGLPLVNQ